MHYSMLALQVAGRAADVSPMLPVAAAPGGLDSIAIMYVAAAVVAIVVLYPIARAIAKRMEPRGAALPAGNPATDARLQALEQSVQAMELELERIAEGQRYTTKMLTERLPLAARVPQPGQGEKTLL